MGPSSGSDRPLEVGVLCLSASSEEARNSIKVMHGNAGPYAAAALSTHRLVDQ